MNALNPVRTIRNHFIDVFKAHGHVPRERWDSRMRELVGKVKLPESMLARYPGELSGACASACRSRSRCPSNPSSWCFDEPTTALDVLVQHAVMDTIIELQRSECFTAVLISHDLGIVLEATERVLVMHEGRIVEDGGSREILRDPQTRTRRCCYRTTRTRAPRSSRCPGSRTGRSAAPTRPGRRPPRRSAPSDRASAPRRGTRSRSSTSSRPTRRRVVARTRCGQSATCPSPSSRASPWRSWASRARASRPSRSC